MNISLSVIVEPHDVYDALPFTEKEISEMWKRATDQVLNRELQCRSVRVTLVNAETEPPQPEGPPRSTTTALPPIVR